MHNDIERLIDNLLRTEADLDRAELHYLDADTSQDLIAARRVHEAAVYAHMQADDVLDVSLEEAWAPVFGERFALCAMCGTDRNALTGGCGYCRDYDEATS